MGLTLLLRELCPKGEVHYVGGTAIAGVPTKGDLDIQVRLPAEALESAALRVSERYSRNYDDFNLPDGVNNPSRPKQINFLFNVFCLPLRVGLLPVRLRGNGVNR